ncbi:sulfatase family protein [Hyunsoonleella jejuensis]|nr:sulfatase-like hydrolase/transferase [Hyunsoonleella jejuensis]
MKVFVLKPIILLLIVSLIYTCKTDKGKGVADKNDSSEITKPNVVFFIADDMYPWMFNNIPQGQSEDGKPLNLTPSLDRLAKEGVWLDNMKVVSPVCTPSRYNVLTGNYASRATNEAFIGFTEKNDGQTVIQWNSYIVPGQPTMGTYFQDLGYKTGFVGKNHIIESLSQVGDGGEKPELDADPTDPKVKEGLEYRYNELQKDIKRSGFDYADKLYHNNPNWLGIRALAYQNMDWIAEGGVEFIDKYSNEPFMLYIASTLPHAPLKPELSWKADRRITPRGILDKAPTVLPQPPVESLKKRIKEAGYQGKDRENLLWLDDAVGALFKKLEEEGVLDNTIVVFFNDHGQDYKGTLYEGGVNSQAFIWKKGGFEVGNVLEAPVSNVDFLPTLLDFAGDKTNLDKFDGKSFKPALEAKAYQGRTSFYHELGYARAVVKDGFKYYAVRYPKWATEFTFEQRKDTLQKYTAFRESFGEHAISNDPNAPYGQLEMVPGGGGAEHNAYVNHPNFSSPDQLYDLKNDPEEQNNLIDNPKYSEILKELKNELNDYTKSLPGKFNL